MKQKYLIGLIIIAILLLGTGLLLCFNNSSTNKLKDNTKSNKDYFDNITGKHCIKNLCIVRFIKKSFFSKIGETINSPKKY